ncbi:MAG TPA: hypothetical protein VF669_03845 [Tepidisphaeraceae bacterium]|jgi:hypothetical protein
MNNLFAPGALAISSFSRRVVSPAIPRVKAGFQTLYLQCNPTKLAERLPRVPQLQLPKMPRLHLPKISKARLSKLPKVKLKMPAMPDVSLKMQKLSLSLEPLKEMRIAASRAIRRRLDVVQVVENFSYHAGYSTGRLMGLRQGSRQVMLFATTASLPEAVLLEPMLKSLAARHVDRELHLWAHEEVCALYSAAPFVAHLRTIKRGRMGQSLSQQIQRTFAAAMMLGRREFSSVLCDARNDATLAHAFERGARTKSLTMIDRSGLAREEERAGRMVRHLAFDASINDLLRGTNAISNEWRGNIGNQSPTVHCADVAAQLAHSRSRAWRSTASSIGASSIVAVCPCAEPADVSVGLGMWASVIRELWQKHRALPVIFSEGADVAAIEQVSSLLEEVPHVRMVSELDVLERAALLARVDVVIGAAGSAAQLALAQDVPAVVIGSEYRKRMFNWAGHRAPYIVASGTGRSLATDVMRGYERFAVRREIRVAG